jgi:hypothetical protein
LPYLFNLFVKKMMAIPSPVCSGPLKTCTGVIFEGNTDKHPNGRRNQTLDGQVRKRPVG